MSENTAQDESAVARYDEEDEVCTGCGQMIDSGSWCHSCTYGQ